MIPCCGESPPSSARRRRPRARRSSGCFLAAVKGFALTGSGAPLGTMFGLAGAVVATIAVFLPVYSSWSRPGGSSARYEEHPRLKGFVKGEDGRRGRRDRGRRDRDRGADNQGTAIGRDRRRRARPVAPAAPEGPGAGRRRARGGCGATASLSSAAAADL